MVVDKQGSTAENAVVSVDFRANDVAMDALTLFGLLSVSAMLVTYACEDRSPWFVLGFAVACALGSVYGFLQGAWPFGVVEAIWALVALRRWWARRGSAGRTPTISP